MDWQTRVSSEQKKLSSLLWWKRCPLWYHTLSAPDGTWCYVGGQAKCNGTEKLQHVYESGCQISLEHILKWNFAVMEMENKQKKNPETTRFKVLVSDNEADCDLCVTPFSDQCRLPRFLALLPHLQDCRRCWIYMCQKAVKLPSLHFQMSSAATLTRQMKALRFSRAWNG